MSETAQALRIDKWLWAARFFKTRSLATHDLQLGRVQVNGLVCKPARVLHVGDEITLLHQGLARTLRVLELSDKRESASLVQKRFQETAQSVQLREAAREQRRLSPEPAASISGGRPSKRDRRDLQKGWGERWSASVDG